MARWSAAALAYDLLVGCAELIRQSVKLLLAACRMVLGWRKPTVNG